MEGSKTYFQQQWPRQLHNSDLNPVSFEGDSCPVLADLKGKYSDKKI
jgi:hypothetical protein